MGLTYRWMQKKDLSKLRNEKSLNKFLKSNRIVANVVEFNNEILGYVVYEIVEKTIKIKKIYFLNDEIFDFIIDKIKNKFQSLIELAVCEYDLDFQITLRSSNFIATRIEKTKKGNFYIFEWEKK